MRNWNVSRKLMLIAGSSSGLGAETARTLASKGARVVITASNPENAKRLWTVSEEMVGQSFDQ